MATTSKRQPPGKKRVARVPSATAAIGAAISSPGRVSLSESATQLSPGVVIGPGVLFKPDSVGNLFDASRAGQPVVRPDDLLALRVQLVNLQVVPGNPPRVRHPGQTVGYLVLHFPPQSIAEEVFYEAPLPGVDENTADKPPPPAQQPAPLPPGDNNVDPPPIRARAAGESRLVFEWPVGFEADYTVEGLLGAVQQLAMRVPKNAKPRAVSIPELSWWPGALLKQTLTKAVSSPASTSGRTTALGSYSLRQVSIALRGGPAAQATLSRRLVDVVPARALAVATQPPRLTRPLSRPEPALPTATETAIELPWRLIVSPHSGERWRHAALAVTSLATRRTELWHSRLVGSAATGARAIEPPHADSQRTVRAVWATTGNFGRPMQSKFPQGITEMPTPGEGDPFLGTLSDYDRYQVAHLSSNFGMSNYQPEPVDTRLLMLSALGGWLDSRGAWDPPGLDVEEWVHRASMGRDHYVRVVYRGVLFPFGHRVALIKVSERKFHGIHGNAAYLRQRMFMVVRERERRYDDAGELKPYGAANDSVKNEFPFTQVRMLTTVTPDLSMPSLTQINGRGQQLFWPAVGPGSTPPLFKFRMSATDLDGRNVEFELPLIFMSNMLASPRTRSGKKLVPLYTGAAAGPPPLVGAAEAAQMAMASWVATQTPDGIAAPNATDRTAAPMKRQRIAMAPSAKAGDTAIEAVSMTFGAHIPGVIPGVASPSAAAKTASINAFKGFSKGLSRPMFFPRVVRAQTRIGALAQLSGSEKLNLLRWNDTYSRLGFNAASNKGEVFADVVDTPDKAQLDFSKQGDRSGGFVMPNLNPSALSRALGPTAGPVGDVLAGKVKPTGFFPATSVPGGLPLPLLFGCIPLSAVIEEVGDLLDNLDKAPKFASEASSKVESFFNDLLRLYQFVSALAEQPASLGDAALAVVKSTLTDLVSQAAAFAPAQRTLVQNRVNTVLSSLNTVRAELTALAGKGFDVANPLAGIDLADALDAPQGNGKLRQALTALRDAVAAQPAFPAGFRQSVNAVVGQALTLLGAFAAIAGLYTHGKALFDALKNLLDNDAPGQSIGELITKPDQLAPKIQAVADALGAVHDDVADFLLLEGPPRKTILSAIEAVETALGTVADLLTLLQNLLGEELVIRFDWKPEIKSWGFDPNHPLFVVHDKHAFIVAVEARVKKSGGPPKIQVLCGLHHFDLVLIAPASFIELNFEKIEFTVDSSAKMNVDVLLTDIKFIGPLSFVETLRDLIPLDGFSDPPYLDITAQGIDAGFSIALPSIGVGVFNLSNVSLGAGFTVPFIGQPLSVRFNFCTREQPFNLSVSMFGGGGFFGITLDPSGIQILEAAFEFGACISIDLGVASGGVSVMAGVYFRMEKDAASLTGYFRLEGHVDVLGLITASLELYLELRYEFETGKAVGRAQLTIEISVFIFSGSVTISCERKFAGSNGDPTFRQLMGLSTDPKLPLADELQAIGADTAYAWRDYCEAFA